MVCIRPQTGPKVSLPPQGGLNYHQGNLLRPHGARYKVKNQEQGFSQRKRPAWLNWLYSKSLAIYNDEIDSTSKLPREFKLRSPILEIAQLRALLYPVPRTVTTVLFAWRSSLTPTYTYIHLHTQTHKLHRQKTA